MINERVQYEKVSGHRPIYMQVVSLKFEHGFHAIEESEKGRIVNDLNELLEGARSEIVEFRIYRSIRYDSDYILWISTYEPSSIGLILRDLKTSSSGFLQPTHGFLSIYQESPYLKKNQELSDTLKEPPLPLFVAYPMWKSSDWYQMSYEERKNIMAEHIGVAVSHPSNKGIRSYTTYSFGISDAEFVVIYEVDDLASWSKVTQALREVQARKWITSETPVLVGSLIEKFEL